MIIIVMGISTIQAFVVDAFGCDNPDSPAAVVVAAQLCRSVKARLVVL